MKGLEHILAAAGRADEQRRSRNRGKRLTWHGALENLQLLASNHHRDHHNTARPASSG